MPATPRTFRQPVVSERMPVTAWEADMLLGSRSQLRLDSHAVLKRHPGETSAYVVLDGRLLVVYAHTGCVTVHVCNPYSLREFRHIAPLAPREWEAQWRGRRMRPRLIYRGVYALGWAGEWTWHPNGDFEWGSGDRILLAELDAEADARENVRARRSNTLPAYVVRTSLMPEEV